MAHQPSEAPSRSQLDTQIHRRKKAKAFSPLLPEWERTDETAPAHLRMDAALMVSNAGRPKRDQARTSGTEL
jgi:hypothetical protein